MALGGGPFHHGAPAFLSLLSSVNVGCRAHKMQNLASALKRGFQCRDPGVLAVCPRIRYSIGKARRASKMTLVTSQRSSEIVRMNALAQPKPSSCSKFAGGFEPPFVDERAGLFRVRYPDQQRCRVATMRKRARFQYLAVRLFAFAFNNVRATWSASRPPKII